MKALLNKIFTNPTNKKVVSFLKLEHSETIRFIPWKQTSGIDEGGAIFFDNYAAGLPDKIKYSLTTHNILVNETSGEIFAFHTGRFSIFFKCDFERNGIVNEDKFRKGSSFDTIEDIRELGENWCYIDKFVEDEQEQLQWAYELSLKQIQ